MTTTKKPLKAKAKTKAIPTQDLPTTFAREAAPAVVFVPPPVPDKHVRVPLDPLWWTKAGELHGALYESEVAEGPDGKPVTALIVIPSLPCRAVDNRGREYAIEVDEAVRITHPSLLKLLPMASHPEVCVLFIARVHVEDGRERWFFDHSLESIPRSAIIPKSAAMRLGL